MSCSKCGFVFADTSAKQEKYTEYYLSFSKYEDKNSVAASGGGIETWNKDRLLQTSKDIQQDILEMGVINPVFIMK